MATPNSNLGISAGFDATQFRNAVKFAMQMGAPTDAARRATFVFPTTGKTYFKNAVAVSNPRLDLDGAPLDPEIQVVEAEPREVVVDCAVEVKPADGSELPVGNFRPTKAEVTLLDADYAQVTGCKELRLNGDRYAFGHESQGYGLFDVGIHVMTFYALEDN